MVCHRLVLLVALAAVLSTASAAQVIDDFENGDISAWNVVAPHYTSLSIVSPGAGGSTKALAIQEVPGELGAHSSNALVHRKFETPQDWSGYVTLELDAAIDSGEWNGYSIRLYNNGQSVLLRGLHVDEPVSGFNTFRFDISSVERDQIDDLIIYVNRTSQNAGQILTVDNIRLSTTPVLTDDVRVIENYSSGSTTYWTGPIAPSYGTQITIASENSPSDSSSPAQCLNAQLAGTGASSTSALFRWRPAQTMDWYDYVTLEFDARITGDTRTDGFSLRIYNTSTTVKLKKIIPGVNDWVTCQIDISEMERDQVKELCFYMNRTDFDSSRILAIDNIRLTKAVMPALPDVVWLDDFETNGNDTLADWDHVYNVSKTLCTTDCISAPNSMDIQLTGTSTSAYIRRSWIASGGPTQDWEDYKYLVFDAKVVDPDPAKPDYPIGFSANVVSGPSSSLMFFCPAVYDTWVTVAVDLSQIECDQVSWLRIYMNRSGRNSTGEILRIDNLRLTNEPQDTFDMYSSNIDDFEDGAIPDWFYSHCVTRGIVNEPGRGNVLRIANGGMKSDNSEWSNTEPYAYTRKLLHGKWEGYKTLTFDARVANSTTDQGYYIRLRSFDSGVPYGKMHSFHPTDQWKTFRIDISNDTYLQYNSTTKLYETKPVRTEVIALLIYPNYFDAYGKSQNGNQELFIDNIRLTNDPPDNLVPVNAAIGDVKNLPDGTYVSFADKIVTQHFYQRMPDPLSSNKIRDIVFIEEPDRSSGIGVMLGLHVNGDGSYYMPGTLVTVTGYLMSGYGQRFIYAKSIEQLGAADVPKPLGMNNKAVGGRASGVIAGPSDGAGLDNTGLRVIIAGKITANGIDPMSGLNVIYVDDGSGVQAEPGKTGVKVYTSLFNQPTDIGKYVTALGLVVTEIDPATYRAYRTIWTEFDYWTYEETVWEITP
ncbi:MAG TPA: hypothetical protein PLU88_04615 [Armatimonadota bacterium]|nr:hypothetical protein [Armatimonadota bacterium]